MKGKTKHEILQKIPDELLIEVHLRSRRKHNYLIRNLNGKELRDFLSRQYTIEELSEIARLYVTNGAKPIEIAERISKPNGNLITDDLLRYFPTSFKGIREVRIHRSPCDLCLIDLNRNIVWALEVKAEGDQIGRAIRQCSDYSSWADYVGVCVMSEQTGFRKRLAKNVGVYEWRNGIIRCIRKPKLNKTDPIVILDSITMNDLKRIAQKYGISLKKTKTELIESLLKKLKHEQISTLFIESLLGRTST